MTDPITPRRGALGRLYHGENRADIVGRWKLWFAISGVLLLVGMTTLAVRGLNLGIDFTGGTVWKAEAGEATVADVSAAIGDLGYSDVQVQELTETIGGREVRTIQVGTDTTVEPDAETTEALDAAVDRFRDLRDGLPDKVREPLDAPYGDLSGLSGPFATPVPQELKELGEKLEALPALLDEAADPEVVATDEARGLQTLVDRLGVLEGEGRRQASQDVSETLAELTGNPIEDVQVDQIGPSWGRQISEKAQTALIVFLAAIAIFITIRFELKMAIATLVALLHDLLMVVGIYAVLGFAVTPSTVVALLTMLGFSIYDGIVVFDRVAANTSMLAGRSKATYSEMANLSLNQVLMRSLNTSITTLLPILSVLVVGSVILDASTLGEFGIALLLGLVSGAYSSLFIATPLLALLKEREPRYRELREQIETRGHGSAAEAENEIDDDPVRTAVLAGGTVPRPRKKGRRR